MKDIPDSGSDETLNVTSDGISVERDSRSHLLNAYGSPINARETERRLLFIARKNSEGQEISFSTIYFTNYLIRSVDTFVAP